jgi:hypothetical protein
VKVQVLAAVDAVAGEKGIFGTTSSPTAVEIDSETLSHSLRDFCRAFSVGLGELEGQVAGLTIKEIEALVEVTVKGEIRLIAAASAETKGSLKIVFSR